MSYSKEIAKEFEKMYVEISAEIDQLQAEIDEKTERMAILNHRESILYNLVQSILHGHDKVHPTDHQ